MLYVDAHNLYVLLAALTVFFSGFNVMEASLPSLVTKVGGGGVKGKDKRSGHRHLFDLTVPWNFHWRHRRRLGAPNWRQREDFCLDGDACRSLAHRSGDNGPTKLSDEPASTRWR
jgi:hypothetical protein